MKRFFLYSLSGVIIFLAGLYVGTKWFAPVNHSMIMTVMHPDHKAVYECGIKGDAECFKKAYSYLAIHNSMHSKALIDANPSGIYAKELAEIRRWNRSILIQ